MFGTQGAARGTEALITPMNSNDGKLSINSKKKSYKSFTFKGS
jgi:hypothetical protein